MTASSQPNSKSPVRAPYGAPALRRIGTVAELTEARSPSGAKDGGPNNTRSA
jgi:hypothetical protein